MRNDRPSDLLKCWVLTVLRHCVAATGDHKALQSTSFARHNAYISDFRVCLCWCNGF
jgi:hypothetical protein